MACFVCPLPVLGNLGDPAQGQALLPGLWKERVTYRVWSLLCFISKLCFLFFVLFTS